MNENKTIELKEALEIAKKPGHFLGVNEEGIMRYGDKQIVHQGELVTKDKFYELVEKTSMVDRCVQMTHEDCKHGDKEIRTGEVTFGKEIITEVYRCIEDTHESCKHSDKEIKPGKVTFGNEKR